MHHKLKRILSFIFGLILTIDGIWLTLLKKMHLGIILPLIIGLILLCYAFFFNAIYQWFQRTKFRMQLYKILWAGFFLWLFSVAIFFSFIQYSMNSHTSTEPSNAILVLGSGIENGKPSPTLKNRLDTAAQYAKDHPQAIIIMTGGLGFKAQRTEAEVMAQYVKEQYPELHNLIKLEDKSTSTELNLANSHPILQASNIQLTDPITIVTSDFHSMRAKAIAEHQGYQNIISLSAPTPLYLRYNSWLREYFAYFSGFILGEY
jgi:uncharacterized SAM-binding protein YcdF (DUF218 family)